MGGSSGGGSKTPYGTPTPNTPGTGTTTDPFNPGDQFNTLNPGTPVDAYTSGPGGNVTAPQGSEGVGSGPFDPAQGSLATNTANAFNQGLSGFQALGGMGMNSYGFGQDLSQQGAGLFQQMGGYTPQNVQAGQVANTDLNPYMNPFQQNVIDATMGELERQRQIAGRNIADQATARGSWGGDRQFVRQGISDAEYDRNKLMALAQLNTQNFGNAQNMAQFDIGNRLQGDLANQGMNAGMKQAGAQGLGSMGQYNLGLGGQLSQAGMGGLANMANMGFGMGQDLQRNQLAMGAMQQQLQQQIMDNIQSQFRGYTNQPRTGLEILMGGSNALNGLNLGTTTQTNKNNPGGLGYLGAGIGLLGLL